MHYALLVGIDQYADQRFADLRWPSCDARNLKQTLVEHPASAFTDDSISVLVDGEAGSSGTPSRLRILEALTAMCDSATQTDLVLFYFAGHGLECDKTPTLIVNDSNSAILPDTGLEVEDLLRIMNRSRAAQRVMLVDACREPADDDAARAVNDPSAAAARGFGGAFKRTISEQSAFGG